MEDGTSRAIPLKRARTTTSRAPVPAPPRRWQDYVTTDTAWSASRQLWLATLGLGALAFRATTATWTVLVDEGARAERALRDAAS